MKSELALSDDQFVKIQKVNQTFREKAKALRGESDDSKPKDKGRFEKLRAEHEANVKAILTKEQLEKWTSLKADRNKKHQKKTN